MEESGEVVAPQLADKSGLKRLPAVSRSVKLLFILCATFLGILGTVRLIGAMPPSTFPKPTASQSCSGVWKDDFLQDYLAARGWRDGQDLYAPTAGLSTRYLGPGASCYEYIPSTLRTPHPPAFVFLVLPLTYLPYHVARIVWLLIGSALLVVTLFVLARRAGIELLGALAVAVGSLALPIVHNSLSFGQSNELLVALLAFAFVSFRKGDERAGGTALGLAAALRVFPILLLIPLIREGKARAIKWTIGVGGASTLCAFVGAGTGTSLRFLTVVTPNNFRFWVAEPRNVSLVGSIYRWLTKNLWFSPGVDMHALAFGLSLAVILGCVVAALRTPATVSQDGFLATMPWMILAAPLAWEHYLVVLLPSIVVVSLAALESHRPPPIAWMLGAAIVVVGIIPGLPVNIGHISVAAQVFGYGLPTIGVVVLAVVDWRPRPADSSRRELIQLQKIEMVASR